MSIKTSHGGSDPTHKQDLIRVANQLVELRYCVLAVPEAKYPPVTPNGKWKQYKYRLPTEMEIEQMCTDSRTQGLCLLGGRISGQVFTRDFEAKDHTGNPMKCIYGEWETKARAYLENLGCEGLYDQFIIHKSRSGGTHVIYRVDTQEKLPTTKLARCWARDDSGEIIRDDKGKLQSNLLIESKAEGGYVLIPPSVGYERIAGDFAKMPVVSFEIHCGLLAIDHEFHTAKDFDVSRRLFSFSKRQSSSRPEASGDRPGDQYNASNHFKDVLEKHGWMCKITSAERELWIRPKKDPHNGHSATFNAPECPGKFYVFSDNADPFEENTPYSPFAVYTLLEHAGDFNTAAKALAAQGDGNQQKKKEGKQNRSQQGRSETSDQSSETGNDNRGQAKSDDQQRTADDQSEQKASPHQWETIEVVLNKISLLSDPTPATIQKRLWDFTSDASYWSGVDLGRFRDTLHTEYGVTKTWLQDWKKEVNRERRKRGKKKARDNELPLILTTDRHLREITQDALNALHSRNGDNPRLFVRGGVLTRIKIYETDAFIAEPLTEKSLRGQLARAADFVGGKDFEGNPAFLPVAPPIDVVNDLISLPEWEGIPILKGIIHAPVFTQGGVLNTAEGYQYESQMYYAPDNDLEIGKINATDEAVKNAKFLIFAELLGEFCFADQASRANALALMLLPFVRLLINGPTPLHLIDAPTEGTGKGLLADVLTYPSKPSGGTLMVEGESDEEWRKRITAVLSEAPSHILIDNISKRVGSGSLAAALTTRYWSDRLLGSNTIAKYPVTQTWIATGNNVEMSPEITRRTVWIRLRPAEEDPSQREFKIENLRKWALEHRSKLVTACLTLVQKSVDEGMPRGNTKKGSYEDWAAILGGILNTIGVDGFLGNYAHLNERANQESAAWRDFAGAWYEKHGFDEVGVADLFLIASTQKVTDDNGRETEIGMGLLNDHLRSNSQHGRRIKLGAMLKAQVDRVYGECRIVSAGRLQGAVRYKLERVGESRESNIQDSQIDSRPDKPSNNAGSDTLRESRESKSAHDEKQGGNISSFDNDDMYAPSDLNPPQTDSPDSQPSPEGVREQGSTARESNRESNISDSQDSRGSTDAIYSAFIKQWYVTHGDNSVAPGQLIPIAQSVGIDLTAKNLSPDENIKWILDNLKDQTLNGLRVFGNPSGTCHLEKREVFVV